MKLEQRIFQGEIPKIAPHLLPENKSFLAENTKLYSGNLQAFKGTVFDYTVQGGTDTIFQYRDGGNTYWFQWSTDVDVVESPVADDANNRIYMSGTVKGLRWTDNSLALSAAPYPNNDRTLVFTPPADAPIVAAGAPPAEPDPFSAETRQYLYTYVTNDGWESSPGPLSTVLNDIYPGQTVTLEIESNPGTLDLDVTYTRIYRTTPAGTIQFVMQLDIGQTGIPPQDPIVDDIATADLGEVLVTTGWTPASNALIGLIALDQGALCAFKDNELWFTEPYIPYAWPTKYQLSTMFNIVAIKSATQNIYIATEGRPYVAFGTNPGEYQLVKIDEDLPCISKNSMVDAGERAFYASTDGIVMFEGTTAKLVTSEIIEESQWKNDYDPSNIKAIWFEQKMFCFTPSTAFIFDPNGGDIVHLDIVVSAVYNSLEENTLYVLVGNDILKWDNDGASFMSYSYHGKDNIYSPTWFSAAKVNANSYADLTFDLYRDSALVHSHVVAGNEPFRLPTKRGRKYSYGLRGTDEVRGVFLASTMSELTNV